jgi:hypothetical protein
MTVMSYGGTAAVVLLMCWAAARVTPLPRQNPPLAALAVVAVFALIAITPLCGFMFDCGCDWPWNGLHHHCNVFDADAKLKCPWCDSKVAGSLSMLAVFGVSAAAAWWVSASGALAGASARTRFHPRRCHRRARLSSRVAGDGDARRARDGIPTAVHRIAVAKRRSAVTIW